MATDGGHLRGDTRPGVLKLRPQRRDTRIVVRVRTDWDHEQFREYVLRAAANAGHTITNTADLATALHGAIGRPMLSKWFRGTEQPSVDSLRKLAPVIRAPLADLLILAGVVDAAELAARPVPLPSALHHRHARTIDALLDENSALPADRRAVLELLLERVIADDLKYLPRKQSKPA